MNRNTNISATEPEGLPCSLIGSGGAAEGQPPVPSAAPSLSRPWGNQPICPGCNRGATYSCICDPFPEDDEQMPASDVVRLMADFFPDTGWGLAERSALNMPGDKL